MSYTGWRSGLRILHSVYLETSVLNVKNITS